MTTATLITGMPGDAMNPTPPSPRLTGSFLVGFDRGKTDEGQDFLESQGIRFPETAESGSKTHNEVYSTIGVAVVTPNPEQLKSIQQAVKDENIPINSVLPETEFRVNPKPSLRQGAPDPSKDATWGLKVTNVVNSPYSGNGIKIAVLDTGFDFSHPDFAGRISASQRMSFVEGLTEAQDDYGHGTHCTGIACGPKSPDNTSVRYGIAYGAEVYIGKVLRSDRTGLGRWIIAGMNWAMQNGCHIISLSMETPVLSGSVGLMQTQFFEKKAKEALDRDVLIIAAAGNFSYRNSRPPTFAPVSNPANARSIMAVGAIDANYQIAPFSDRAQNPDGGEVNIAAPGVGVYSSWLVDEKYKYVDGTSQATPYVTGIAALYAEKEGLRGKALWDCICKNARPLTNLSGDDVGAGLIQAPQ
jgi:subtilisin family serine protease